MKKILIILVLVLMAIPLMSFAKLGDTASTREVATGGCDPNGGYCTQKPIDTYDAIFQRLHDLEYAVSIIQKEKADLEQRVISMQKEIITALTAILKKLK